MDLQEISLAVEQGKGKRVKELVSQAVEEGADIVCLSALLTTTMPAIGDVIKDFRDSGVRSEYHIMIGGAPVSQLFADQVGADTYTANASDAADAAKAFLHAKAI